MAYHISYFGETKQQVVCFGWVEWVEWVEWIEWIELVDSVVESAIEMV